MKLVLLQHVRDYELAEFLFDAETGSPISVSEIIVDFSYIYANRLFQPRTVLKYINRLLNELSPYTHLDFVADTVSELQNAREETENILREKGEIMSKA